MHVYVRSMMAVCRGELDGGSVLWRVCMCVRAPEFWIGVYGVTRWRGGAICYTCVWCLRRRAAECAPDVRSVLSICRTVSDDGNASLGDSAGSMPAPCLHRRPGHSPKVWFVPHQKKSVTRPSDERARVHLAVQAGERLSVLCRTATWRRPHRPRGGHGPRPAWSRTATRPYRRRRRSGAQSRRSDSASAGHRCPT